MAGWCNGNMLGFDPFDTGSTPVPASNCSRKDVLTQNRITRSLSELLCLCLMCACLVVPASASEVAGNSGNEEIYFNVFDYYDSSNYCTVNTSGSISFSSASSDFILPSSSVDILLFVGEEALTGVSLTINGVESALSFIKMGDGWYRVTGHLGAWLKNNFQLNFYNSGGTSYVSVYKFDVSPLSSTAFDWQGDLYCNGEFVGTTSSAIGSIAGYNYYDILSGTVSYEVLVDDWQRFDYLDIFLTFSNIWGVVNIYAFCGDSYVPCSTVQYDNAEFMDEIGILAQLDLTGLLHDSTDSVRLVVEISYSRDEFLACYLQSVSGRVVPEFPDAEITWLKKISNTLSVFKSSVESAFVSLQSAMVSWFSSVSYNIQSLHVTLSGFWEDVCSWFLTVSDQLSSLKTSMETWFNSVHSKLVSFQTSMETWFSSLRTAMVNWFSTVSDQIHSLHSTLSDFWSDVCSWFLTVSDQLATLIGNGSEGDSLSDASGQLNNAADDVFDYEQSQQEILTNSFPAIQETVSFTGFVTALMFVQKYTNLTYAGLGDVSIIYMLPLVLGLFFYLCSRIPGATRWPARTQRKKDGDAT